MSKDRLETFSDGVIAIIITVMVLGLRTPRGSDLAALRPLGPILLSYVLSFVNLGLYWNNHHHLFQAVERVNGLVLWANLHLLFWLSLLPFATAWMGENNFATWPVALYGVDLLLSAVAYTLLVRALLAIHEPGSTLAKAIGTDLKGRVSTGLYLLALPVAFLSSWVSLAIYFLVAAMWLAPDPRIEKRMAE
jgi:uncharacterized membrane protein